MNHCNIALIFKRTVAPLTAYQRDAKPEECASLTIFTFDKRHSSGHIRSSATYATQTCNRKVPWLLFAFIQAYLRYFCGGNCLLKLVQVYNINFLKYFLMFWRKLITLTFFFMPTALRKSIKLIFKADSSDVRCLQRPWWMHGIDSFQSPLREKTTASGFLLILAELPKSVLTSSISVCTQQHSHRMNKLVKSFQIIHHA